MPHKRNPITAERLTGLARLLRGYLLSGFEDVALWHERDISHSSVERVILPDASLVAYYSLRRAARLVDGLVVRPDRMLENLTELSHGLVFSQPVLLALVRAGLSRDSAYRIVQRDAGIAHEERVSFRSVLEKDADVVALLGPSKLSGALDEAFDLTRSLARARRTIDALEEIAE
jgi:adenylosuccinate lyase